MVESCVVRKLKNYVRSVAYYTPDKSGIAERMNKTLMERVRRMLSCAGFG